MNDTSRLASASGRRSGLLIGLAFALLISILQLATDVLEYRSVSITMEGIRLPPHFAGEEVAIDGMQDRQEMLRLRMVSHATLVLITFWYLRAPNFCAVWKGRSDNRQLDN